MRRTIEVLSLLAAVCAMLAAVSPASASCPFSLPMLQGGDTGLPPGAIINAGATHVNGFFWELGFGAPADGVGNDGSSLVTMSGGAPPYTHPVPSLRWIKGAPDAPQVDFDWFNSGIDNCISGGAAAIVSTVIVSYILDSNDHYAIAAAAGTSTPIPHYNLDLLVTGFGPNGNDVLMGPRTVKPQLANLSVVDDNCLDAEILPAEADLRLYYDAGGPYSGVVSVRELVLNNGDTEETCDPEAGCHLNCVQRNASLCWVGEVDVIASQPGSSSPICLPTLTTPCSSDADCGGTICQFFPTISCDPADPTTCFGGAAGPCITDTCFIPAQVIVPYGPPIVGDCVSIDGPPDADPDPESQGYWHRQCLGIPEGEGGLAPGRSRRGPSQPLEPGFQEVLMPAVDALLQDTLFDDRGTCQGGMDATPPSDPCEKAAKQYTALLLNLESGRLSPSLDIDLSAEGCASTDVGSLLAEMSGLINSSDPSNCKLAADCGAAVNEGAALAEGLLSADEPALRLGVPPRTLAGSGDLERAAVGSVEAGETTAEISHPLTSPGILPLVPRDPSWVDEAEVADAGAEETGQEPPVAMHEDDLRAIRRHLAVLANANSPQRAREVSMDALLTALSGGYETELRLEIVKRLLGEVVVAYESLLAEHLRDIRDEAVVVGKNDVARAAERFLKRLEFAEE